MHSKVTNFHYKYHINFSIGGFFLVFITKIWNGIHILNVDDERNRVGTSLEIPVVKTPRFHSRGHRFNTWSGN